MLCLSFCARLRTYRTDDTTISRYSSGKGQKLHFPCTCTCTLVPYRSSRPKKRVTPLFSVVRKFFEIHTPYDYFNIYNKTRSPSFLSCTVNISSHTTRDNTRSPSLFSTKRPSALTYIISIATPLSNILLQPPHSSQDYLLYYTARVHPHPQSPRLSSVVDQYTIAVWPLHLRYLSV